MINNYDMFADIRTRIHRLGQHTTKRIILQYIPKQNKNKHTTQEMQRVYTLLETADALAAEAHYSFPKVLQQEQWSLHETCAIREGNIHCTGQELHRLCTNWPMIQIQTYYADKWHITVKQCQEYNWQSFASINKKLSEHEKRFVTKLLTKWLPVGHNLNKYTTVHHTCPFCHDIESVYHLFKCTLNPLANKHFLEKLEKYLDEIDTEPFLQLIIMNNFRDGMNTIPNTGEPIPNWYLACAGLLPMEWTNAQTTYQHTAKPQHQSKGLKWTNSLSKWLINKSYSIWKHRNNHLHQSHNTSIKISQLHYQVTELYTSKTQLLPQDTFFSLEKKVHVRPAPCSGRCQNWQPLAPHFTSVTPTFAYRPCDTAARSLYCLLPNHSPPATSFPLVFRDKTPSLLRLLPVLKLITRCPLVFQTTHNRTMTTTKTTTLTTTKLTMTT